MKQNMRIFLPAVFAAASILLPFAGGCKAVSSVDQADRADLENESTVVFTRPSRYVAWGTKSLRDYLEVTYERFYTNDAGQDVLEVGLRFRGATHWYDYFYSMPESVTFTGRANFYPGKTRSGAPLYSTNRQTILIRRGDTFNFKAVSPRKGAGSYQLVLSESGELVN
ncbi:MAG: hypothetical protein AB7F32_01165 [Victivallaceae bacterium]